MYERVLRELHRRRAVDRLEILNTETEPLFDRLVSRVATAFDAPVALLSIADRNRLWFKSTMGTGLTSVRRCESFCTHVLDRDDLLEICNAAESDLFRALPIVSGSAGIRYYLGAGLRLSNGVGVGSLCVLDTVERPEASNDQRAFLKAMARQAEIAIEFDRTALEEQAA